ncbi:hypothetical protein BUE80_DR011285 [Diplocarpon rosae]|nr:hypothetical protein BUE80_DR011285 [Diplocarpon rosae]
MRVRKNKALEKAMADREHRGQPKEDKDIDIQGEYAYVAEPYGNYAHKNEGKAILLVSDSLGLCYNSRLLADQFAGARYLTGVPNYTGRLTPPTSELTCLAEVIPSRSPEKRHTTLINAIEYMYSRAVNQIAAAGYSTGGTELLTLLRVGRYSKIGFVAQPEAYTPDDFKELEGPLSLVLGDEDDATPQEARFEIETYLMKGGGYPYQINLYSHVGRGFSSNRAVKSKAGVYAKKQSFIQALQWSEEHLHNGD